MIPPCRMADRYAQPGHRASCPAGQRPARAGVRFSGKADGKAPGVPPLDPVCACRQVRSSSFSRHKPFSACSLLTRAQIVFAVYHEGKRSATKNHRYAETHLWFCQISLAEFRFPQKSEANQIMFSPAPPGKTYCSRREPNSPGDCLVRCRRSHINVGADRRSVRRAKRNPPLVEWATRSASSATPP